MTNELAARKHRSCLPYLLENCEAGCGPASHKDSEGVFLCCECWEELLLVYIRECAQ